MKNYDKDKKSWSHKYYNKNNFSGLAMSQKHGTINEVLH